MVRPHLQTSWGKFSVIDAMLKALQLMFDSNDPPEWLILLSGADYPIKSADKIMSDLRESPYDAHIQHEQLWYERSESVWHECYRRYCVKKFKVPVVDSGLRFKRRTITVSHPMFTAPFVPFSRNFRCFAGEHWFSANRAAAQLLLNYHSKEPVLAAHYRSLEKFGTIVPEESYYQTIFGNERTLKVSQNFWRYVVWSDDGVGPKTLGLKDLQSMLASTAHFARKFDMERDCAVFDELDAIIR